jgi:hypothetical protein
MTTLREARQKGKLEQFIAEREDQARGDKRAFDKTVSAMAGKSKAARPASKKGCADD